MKKSTLFIGVIVLAGLVPLSALRGKKEEEKKAHPEVTVQRDFTELDRSNRERITSFADILEDVTPAVVSVSTSVLVRNDPRQQQMEELLRRMYGMPSPHGGRGESPEEEIVPLGIGSGFIVSKEGYILTNHHVISGQQGKPADQINVQLTDGRAFEAELIGSDPDTDIAVIKITGENLPTLPFADSKKLRVGDIMFAVGNPLGVGLTVTQGIVSAMGRTDLNIIDQFGRGFENFIQTDAAINQGNSGGPLVDANGRVVGINAAIYSQTGGSIGIGFAIPIDLAYNVMQSLVNDGEVRRGFLGVLPEDLTPELARGFGLEGIKGAIISEVTPNMPAELAGVRHGDVVTHVGNDEVGSARELRYLIAGMNPGSTANLSIIRRGEKMNLAVILGDREKGIVASNEQEEMDLLEGIVLKSLSDELREEFEIPEDLSGVAILDVKTNSPYFRQVLKGMLILELNGESVATLADIQANIKENEVNIFRIFFKGRYTYLPISLTQ